MRFVIAAGGVDIVDKAPKPQDVEELPRFTLDVGLIPSERLFPPVERCGATYPPSIHKKRGFIEASIFRPVEKTPPIYGVGYPVEKSPLYRLLHKGRRLSTDNRVLSTGGLSEQSGLKGCSP